MGVGSGLDGEPVGLLFLACDVAEAFL